MQVTNQMGHSKIETTKNIYGHLFAQDRAQILKAMNEAVSRLYVQADDSAEDELPEGAGTTETPAMLPPGSTRGGRCLSGPDLSPVALTI